MILFITSLKLILGKENKNKGQLNNLRKQTGMGLDQK